MMRRALPGFLVILAYLPSTGGPQGVEAPRAMRASRIPERPRDAPTATAFSRKTVALSGRQRQSRAVIELCGGNLPAFLRDLKPVRLSSTVPGRPPLQATVWVMPDYLAVGSDDDFLRMPLTYPSAVAVAQCFGMVLPTRKMVDAIYDQAALKLQPLPMPPGPNMRSMSYFLTHQRNIEKQRAGHPLGELVSGDKKDVVITRRLLSQKGRIAIYGWHRGRGRPIQPLSLVHGARYADYSHGVRLIHATVWIDGSPRSIAEVLADPMLGPVLSNEGTIPGFGRLMDPKTVAAQSP